MLPILHAPNGPLTVAAVGPFAAEMAAEALKWHDVKTLYVLTPVPLKDHRIKVVKTLPAGEVQVLLLSPEQRPSPWWGALAKDGVIMATTGDQKAWQSLLDEFRLRLGKATPLRNWVPKTLFGVMGRNGPAKAGRTRQPPKGAAHLSAQYLPVLFTFSKDELPIAFTRQSVRIANHPEGP